MDTSRLDDLELLDRLDAGEPYERLIVRIRQLPDIPPLSGWEDRLHTRWLRARRASRIRRVALLAIAIAGVILLLREFYLRDLAPANIVRHR